MNRRAFNSLVTGLMAAFAPGPRPSRAHPPMPAHGLATAPTALHRSAIRLRASDLRFVAARRFQPHEIARFENSRGGTQ